jgi:hypothetical protein
MFGVLRSYDAPEILVIVSATLFVVGTIFVTGSEVPCEPWRRGGAE